MPRTLAQRSRRPATQARGDVTRAKLLECAHRLFLQRGFHGTSMREMAEAAGIAVGGIYNHYRNKEEIFAAVLDAYHPYHVVLPALETIEGETVEEFMRQAARHIHDGVSGAEKQLLPLIFIELVEFQGRHLKQLIPKIMPPILRFIERFREQPGRLRRIPPPVMFRTFMGMLVGYFLSEMLLRDSPLFRLADHKWFDGMVDIYLHGILVPEG